MTIKSIGEKIDTLCNISNSTGTNKLDKIIKGMCKIYIETIIADDAPPHTRVKKHPFYTFDQVDEDTSYIYYTVLKEDLPRLHRALGLDALGGSVRLDNGMEFGTEEALLILLYKFTFPTRNIQLVEMFGRDHTFIGRVFNWMNKYIREHHGHLVTSNLAYWKAYLEGFSEAI
jgi:hypothetical protein